MRVALISAAALLLFISTAFAYDPAILEICTFGDEVTYGALGQATDSWGDDNGFEATTSITVTGFSAYLNKTGTPPEDLIVSIRETEDGADLASVTIEQDDLTTGKVLYSYEFDDAADLTTGTYYISFNTTGRNNSNFYGVYRKEGGSCYSGGIFSRYDTTWVPHSDWDIVTEILGIPTEEEPPPEATSTLSTSTLTASEIVYTYLFFILDALWFVACFVAIIFTFKFIFNL